MPKQKLTIDQIIEALTLIKNKFNGSLYAECRDTEGELDNVGLVDWYINPSNSRPYVSIEGTGRFLQASPDPPETAPTPKDDYYLYPIGETFTQAILEGVKRYYNRTTAQVHHYPDISLSSYEHERLNIVLGKDEKILDVYLG